MTVSCTPLFSSAGQRMKCDKCEFKSDSMQMFVVDTTKKKTEVKCRPCSGCIIKPHTKIYEVLRHHTPGLLKNNAGKVNKLGGSVGVKTID